MRRQLTATVYIVDHNRILLIYHKKHRKWLPPGGHVKPNEIPTQAAIREAFEETGLEVQLFSDENLKVEQPHAISIPRPFLCLLENIPASATEEAHQHIDMIYLGKPVGGQLQQNLQETDGMAWYRLEEVLSLDDKEIFVETKEVIATIFEMQTKEQEVLVPYEG